MNLRFSVVAGVIGLLLVAGLLLAAGRKTFSSEKVGPVSGNAIPEDLFVQIDQEAKDRLLRDWRWKVGESAKVLRVTVFGDLFTQTPDGHIYWLDTGSGRYVKAAESIEQLAEAAKIHGSEWFRWTTLQELRSLGVEPAKGKVFSWQLYPMHGGDVSVSNIDFASAVVHVSFAGQLAEALHDLPPGAKLASFHFEPQGRADGRKESGDGDDDTTLYNVVINNELQYSMWPVGRETPSGWKNVGKIGTKQECLDYIKEVWTDLRPLSLRKKMEDQERRR